MVEATAAEIGINPLLFKHLTSPRTQLRQPTYPQIKQISPPTPHSTPDSAVGLQQTPDKQEPSPPPEIKPEVPFKSKRIPRLESRKKPLSQKEQPIATGPLRKSRRLLLAPEQTPKKQVQNLRADRLIKKRLLKVRSRSRFSDKLLLDLEDVSKYHSYLTDSVECANEIIELSREPQKSQTDAFSLQTNNYFLMSWLGVVRIFEYNNRAERYNEIKRIPERYFSLRPQVITSVHFSESKLYIAYLWGNQETESEPETKSRPFVEVRDLYGNLLKKRYYYDDIIRSISSSEHFISVITTSNTVHIHRKLDFDLFPIELDFSSFNCGQIVDVFVKFISWHSNTSIQILIAVPDGIIVAQYSAVTKLIIKQWYTLEKEYATTSMVKLQDRVIFHRTLSHQNTSKPSSNCLSTIDFGYMKTIKTTNSTTDYFIHDLSLRFKCQLLEVRLFDAKLFLFGVLTDELGNESYQLGCLDLKTCNPLWIEELEDADRSCRILVNDSNVVLVKKNQRHHCIKIDLQTQVECGSCKFNLLEKAQAKHANHKSIFVDLTVHVNKNIVY